MIRCIGRERSDSSPVKVASKSWPATTPASRRIVVPLLPQSKGSFGVRQSARPGALNQHIVAFADNCNAKLLKTAQRRRAILTRRKVPDTRRAVRQSGNHRRPMGNRFIARHLKLANDSFRRVNDHEGILARRIATPKYALQHPGADIDTRPASMLHVRLPFAFESSAARPRFPWLEACAFCDRSNDSTRFAQPH